MGKIIQEVVDALNIDAETIIIPKYANYKALTLKELLNWMYPDNGSAELAKLYGKSESSMKNCLSTYLGKIWIDKPRTVKWAAYLFAKAGYSFCNSCKMLKHISEFNADKTRYLHITSKCKLCCSDLTAEWGERTNYYENNKSEFLTRNSIRRANKKSATPAWANLDTIKEIYATCPIGYHVDHIVPLSNPLVCGLHVENNLQHLSAKENLAKGNKFNIE